MKEVYEKLLENLSNMTPEEKEKDCEELKKYNEIGPEVEEILKVNKMEKQIGEIFIYNGKKFEFIEGSCDDCCFRYINCPLYDDIGACVSREDGKIACFKLIE